MAVRSCFGVVYLLITVLSHWAPGLLRSDILGNETNWRQAVPEKKDRVSLFYVPMRIGRKSTCETPGI